MKTKYHADDPWLIDRIRQLNAEEIQAIAVCNYHPVDAKTFYPAYQADTAYRRLGVKHPFFEKGYKLDIRESRPLPPVDPLSNQTQMMFLGDLNEVQKKKLDAQTVYENPVQPKERQTKNFIVNFLFEGQAWFYFVDKEGKKQLLEDPVSTALLAYTKSRGLKPGKKTGNGPYYSGNYIPRVNLPNEEISRVSPDLNLDFRVEVIVLRAPEKINKDEIGKHKCFILLDKDNQIEEISFTTLDNNHKPAVTKYKNIEANKALEKIITTPGNNVKFLTSEAFQTAVVASVAASEEKKNALHAGSILVYPENNQLHYQFKGIDNRIHQGICGNLRLFMQGKVYDEDKIMQAIQEQSQQTQIAPGNVNFDQLKLYLKKKEARTKFAQQTFGFNEVVLGAKKEKSGRDGPRPLVKKSESSPLQKLEDQILNHKVHTVKKLVDKVSEILQPGQENALRINTSQSVTNYPALVLNINFDLCSGFIKTLFDEESFHNRKPDKLEKLVGCYLLNKKPAKGSQGPIYSIEYVTPDKKVHDLKLDPDKQADLAALVEQVENDGVDISAVSLKGYVKNPKEGPFEAHYAAFTTQLLMGFINNELYKKGLGVYFDSRASFGFLTPTAADVGTGIRLSMGLVPNQDWEDAVVKGTENFNAFMTQYLENNKNFMPEICDNFSQSYLRSYAHKLFLDALIKEDSFRSIDKLLNKFQSKKSIQKLVKPFEEKEGFKELSETLKKQGRVAFEQTDKGFQKLFNRVVEIYNYMEDALQIQTEQDAEQSHSLYEKMVFLRDKIDNFRWQSYLTVQAEAEAGEEIDISSESEEEDRLDEEENPEPKDSKHYTRSGMTALSLPLVVFGKLTGMPVNYYLAPYTYYETEEMQSFFKDNEFQKVDESKDASVMYYTNEACVTSTEKPAAFEEAAIEFLTATNKSGQKVLIVDITSSTKAAQDKILKFWAEHGGEHILCFAQSALKNRQLALDMAHYGSLKLFCNDDKNPLYLQMKKETRQLTAQTSSVYSTKIRRLLREAAAHADTKQAADIVEKQPGRYSIFQTDPQEKFIKQLESFLLLSDENETGAAVKTLIQILKGDDLKLTDAQAQALLAEPILNKWIHHYNFETKVDTYVQPVSTL